MRATSMLAAASSKAARTCQGPGWLSESIKVLVGDGVRGQQCGWCSRNESLRVRGCGEGPTRAARQPQRGIWAPAAAPALPAAERWGPVSFSPGCHIRKQNSGLPRCLPLLLAAWVCGCALRAGRRRAVLLLGALQARREGEGEVSATEWLRPSRNTTRGRPCGHPAMQPKRPSSTNNAL
jgi:hypothetical protein